MKDKIKLSAAINEMEIVNINEIKSWVLEKLTKIDELFPKERRCKLIHLKMKKLKQGLTIQTFIRSYFKNL